MPSFVPLLSYGNPNAADPKEERSGVRGCPCTSPNTPVDGGSQLTLGEEGEKTSTSVQGQVQENAGKRLLAAKRKPVKTRKKVPRNHGLGAGESMHPEGDTSRAVQEKHEQSLNEVEVKAQHYSQTLRVVKKAVLEVQLLLLDGIQEYSQLQAAGRLLTKSEYADVVTERSISKLCGYALCNNHLSAENTRKGRYRISLSAKKVYDIQESSQFCHVTCLISSKEFASSLVNDRDAVKLGKSVPEIITAVRGSKPSKSKLATSKVSGADPSGKVSHNEPDQYGSESASSSSAQVPKAIKDIKGAIDVSNVRNESCTYGSASASSSSTQVPKAAKDIKCAIAVSNLGDDRRDAKQTDLVIKEHLLEREIPANFDYVGPSNAVEGYIPKRSYGQVPQVKAVARVSSEGKNDPNALSELVETSISSSNKEAEMLEYGVQFFANEENGDNSHIADSIAHLLKGSTDTGTASSLVDSSEKMILASEELNSHSRGRNKFVESSKSSLQTSTSKECAGKADLQSTECDVLANDISLKTDVEKGTMNLKSALKKQRARQKHGRNVSWVDEKGGSIKEISCSPGVSESGNSSSINTILDSLSDLTMKDVSVSMDNNTNLGNEGGKQERLNSLQSSLKSAREARLASAEAVAAALTQAATAAATGELDGNEAVARAGLSILSATHNASVAAEVTECKESFHLAQDADEDETEEEEDDDLIQKTLREQGEMRWRQVRPDDFEDEDEDDEDGYLGARNVQFHPPPTGFKAEVSMFGTIYMAFEGWISARTIAHIYGKESHEEDKFLSVGGREYSQQTIAGDAVSVEISRSFSVCLSRVLPEVVHEFHLSTPTSTIERALGRVINTMSFYEALPPFGVKQWRLVILLLLDALSVQRLPGIVLSNNRAIMRKVSEFTGTSEAEYDAYRDVLLPSGRSPLFASLSGG